MNALHSALATRLGETPLRSVELGPRSTVPSARTFVRLLGSFLATGGTVPGELMSEMLRGHCRGDLVALARLIVSKDIFAFGWRGSLWLPMFQFDPVDLSVAVAPQEVRVELPAMLDGWAVACWFASPHVVLGGCLPVDLLRTDLDAVRDAARLTSRNASMSGCSASVVQVGP